MSIDIGPTVGFFFDAFCWFIGLCFVGYSVVQTARNVKRQIFRGIVEEGLDIKRAAEKQEFAR